MNVSIKLSFFCVGYIRISQVHLQWHFFIKMSIKKKRTWNDRHWMISLVASKSSTSFAFYMHTHYTLHIFIECFYPFYREILHCTFNEPLKLCVCTCHALIAWINAKKCSMAAMAIFFSSKRHFLITIRFNRIENISFDRSWSYSIISFSVHIIGSSDFFAIKLIIVSIYWS